MRQMNPFLIILTGIVGCNFGHPSNRISEEEYAVMSAVLDTVHMYPSRCIAVYDSTTTLPQNIDGLPAAWPWEQMPSVGAPVAVPDADVDTTFVPESTVERSQRPSSTNFDEILRKLQKEQPNLEWADLISDFRNANTQQVPLDSASFHTRQLIHLLPVNFWHLSDPVSRIDSLGGGAIVRFARVGFNRAHSQAIVFYLQRRDGFVSYILALSKQNLRWIVLSGVGSYGI